MRGSKFEARLYANSALELRIVLCRPLGSNPETIRVIDFRAVKATSSDESKQQAEISVMRSLMRDLAAGRPVPELLIQPPLEITVALSDARVVYPDYALLDPSTGMYVPGEVKSFIARDNRAPHMSLVRVRRQAAVYVVALQEEAERVSLSGRVSANALLIFASPYGMRPTDVYREQLDAEISEVQQALVVLRQTRYGQSVSGAKGASADLKQMYNDGRINFIDQCMSICALYPLCKRRVTPTTRILGDDVAAILGQNREISRLDDLMRGAEALTEFDVSYVRAASEISVALGLGWGPA